MYTSSVSFLAKKCGAKKRKTRKRQFAVSSRPVLSVLTNTSKIIRVFAVSFSAIACGLDDDMRTLLAQTDATRRCHPRSLMSLILAFAHVYTIIICIQYIV